MTLNKHRRTNFDDGQQTDGELGNTIVSPRLVIAMSGGIF